MTDTPTIRVEGVSKRYGDAFAVREVDLDLAAGECVAMVGHNGAGKSSLIKLMLGLTTPTAGSVRVLGGDPASAAASHIRRQVGFLPESVAFHPSMTGRETLDFYARLKRVPRDGNDALFERVGLEPAAVKRRVGTYSKGMRQRLALAQALLDRPRPGAAPELLRDRAELARCRHHRPAVQPRPDRAGGAGRPRRGDEPRAQGRRRLARHAARAGPAAGAHPPDPAVRGGRGDGLRQR
ncbi:ABC transporter ATP-binding protein [Azospirillum brasilense]|uniref:ABC transporter ATP-binding protein n=1 Tax=Azospirillum brasilense TaxID=192 RepID=UPI0003A34092|nr:ABC transporter ATP-binding protein [Azospirillum brasilense]